MSMYFLIIQLLTSFINIALRLLQGVNLEIDTMTVYFQFALEILLREEYKGDRKRKTLWMTRFMVLVFIRQLQ